MKLKVYGAGDNRTRPLPAFPGAGVGPAMPDDERSLDMADK